MCSKIAAEPMPDVTNQTIPSFAQASIAALTCSYSVLLKYVVSNFGRSLPAQTIVSVIDFRSLDTV